MATNDEERPADEDVIEGGQDESRGAIHDDENAGGLSELEAPLLPRSQAEETGDQSLENNADDEEGLEDPHTTKQCCGRLVLGLLYVGISVYMVLLLLTGNVMGISFGPPKDLFRDASLSLLFVSWGCMAIFVGINGLAILCVKKYRAITAFLAPLTLLIIYLVMSWFYLWVRNRIKYGGSSDGDDDDVTDDGV
mmetsp:Transcript_18005/g.49006  ORF Transcript_18005/g.49006 Transcript_18005/m.49006 type:complete len:194 (+) Transcript_18005:72-653(+)